MALKRINKELTDLGRYVAPSPAPQIRPSTAARMTTLRVRGFPCPTMKTALTKRPHQLHTDDSLQ